jgi:choline dehydrogenase-like flavoprotein
MLFDFGVAADRLKLTHYDVCVCGAGPAGITIARKLAQSGKHVVLLEAGGFDPTEQSQSIYDGENIGIQTYYGLNGCRLRYFGGTSNHWSGLCGLLDEVDFMDRGYTGLPGWPISRQDVLATLSEARDILDLGKQSFDTPRDPLWVSSTLQIRGTAQSPPTRFGEKYRSEIIQSSKIDLFLNANVVDILMNSSLTTVSSFVVRDYSGGQAAVTANNFVVAFGGIENARILLNSNTQIASGIGNHSDFVGRCFMEHPEIMVGRFIQTNEAFWRVGKLPLQPTKDFVIKEKIGNGVLSFNTSYSGKGAGGRLRALREALYAAECGLRDLAEVSAYLFDTECPGDGIVTLMCEQEPDAESRVTLGSDRDQLGLRRTVFNYEINEKDKFTIRTLAREAAKEMARLDLARIQLKDYILDDTVEIANISGNCHHMGTTRMSSSPKRGVVDENSRIHGINNLYVAGGSVFPRGGFTNPTLTIVLMSLRLAQHLNRLD